MVCQFWTSKGIEILEEISSHRGLLNIGMNCSVEVVIIPRGVQHMTGSAT